MKITFYSRSFGLGMILCLVFQLGAPTVSLALTGGPSQPEVQSYMPVEANDMVDLFTGDFSYNIPLFDVEGYPINLIYNGNLTPDQEASWVGLGWNINPGVINRNMRGIPDDFNGEKIIKETSIRPNETYGVTAGFSSPGEIANTEILRLGVGLGASYNNYNGVASEVFIDPTLAAGKSLKGTMNFHLGSSSANGLSISATASLDQYTAGKSNPERGLSLGAGYNTRTGMKTFSLSGTYTNKTAGRTASGSKSFDFTSITSYPKVNLAFKNFGGSLSAKFGGTFFAIEGTYDMRGYWSRQELENNKAEYPAYGFLNLQNATAPTSMMDFNREKDQTFTINTPNLAVTNPTFDVYTINGAGAGGTFRAYRSQVGTFSDPVVVSNASSRSLGGEFSVGNAAKSGANVGASFTTTASRRWDDANDLSAVLRFNNTRKVSVDTPLSFLEEPAYFKVVGEKVTNKHTAVANTFGREGASKVQLNNTGGYHTYASADVNRYNQANATVSSNNSREAGRNVRSTAVSHITAGEAKNGGSPFWQAGANGSHNHHIGEVHVNKNDGSRYIYGLPAYNLSQEECSFAVGHNALNGVVYGADQRNGLVNYNSTDASIKNQKGRDNFYQKTVIPPYVHSYFLSAVLSADYRDADTVPGPSPGDNGSYTYFKYKKINNAYKWRVPYESNKANHIKGLKSDPTDDQGTFIQGTKEVWYLDTIRSKNYIAIFETEARQDALPVDPLAANNENDKSRRLKKISLYSLKDYMLNINKPEPYKATPIKEVHFVYDYSLCEGVPNSSSPEKGKLTLKSVYFTYGKSKKGAMSPYAFTYANNPGFHNMDYDRWGHFRPNAISSGTSSVPGNDEFPYLDQENSADNDLNASAWALTSIQLPSGGIINIEYESDDYAYVQKKRAMQMMEVVRADQVDLPLSQYQTVGLSPSSEHFMIKLPSSQTLLKNTNTAAENAGLFHRLYMDDSSLTYFKFLMNVTGGNKSNYEYVSGYLEFDMDNAAIQFYDGDGDSYYDYVRLKVKKVNIGDRKNSELVNPVCKATWQFGRLRMPLYVYDQPVNADNATPQVIFKSLLQAFANFSELFNNANGVIKNKSFGQQFIANKSWFRFYNPDGKKFGGGSRVKKLTINDNWLAMSGKGENFDYGQTYAYTKEEDGRTISSGVAAYEPLAGGDENPFRQPIAFNDNENNLLVPDDKFYMEEPMGESLFPSPVVGYSKVTVKNIESDEPGNTIDRHGTGRVETEFYTARDFPTFTDRTLLEAPRKKTPNVYKLWNNFVRDYITASQGYYIELNDMHGKLKSKKIFGQSGTTPISEVEYVYQAIGDRLDQNCKLIRSDGSTIQQEVGVSYETYADAGEHTSFTAGAQVKPNANCFLAALFPAVIPSVFFSVSTESTRFRSIVITKVVHKTGILKEIITKTDGAEVRQENVAYDAGSGELLLTRMTNEFGESVYVLKTPASWVYPQMGGSYKNIGALVTFKIGGGGVVTMADADKVFVDGDELIRGSEHLWVDQVGPGSFKCIDDQGNPAGAELIPRTRRIVRSGYRNMQTDIVQSITTLNIDPLVGSPSNVYSKILESSAVTFHPSWPQECNCTETRKGNNPYLNGEKNNWRPQDAWSFIAERTQSNNSGAVDTRSDGTYTMTPFWQYTAGTWQKNEAGWVLAKQITLYDPNGRAMEEKNAIGIYNSEVYAPNWQYPKTAAGNTPYHENGAASFELYEDDACDKHFNLLSPNISKHSTSWSHTGSGSLKIPAGGSVQIKKRVK